MAPKTKEQYQDIRQEKRAQIMDAALKVFAAQGYNGASINQIAKEAGIAKGLLYSYFDSKETLLKAILLEGIAGMAQAFAPAVNVELTPDLVEQLVRGYFKMLKENINFWRLYFAIALQPNIIQMIDDEIAPMSAQFMNILVAYYEKQGSKNPMADFLLSHALLDGITFNMVVAHHDFDMALIEQVAIDQVVKPNY